jgi:large subunit ribosomal protein L23
MDLKYIIKRPVITEKSLTATKDNRYTFEVDVRASKNQISSAIETMFKVDVIGVKTMIKKPTHVSTGRKRLPGTTPSIKKAIVEIKAGQTIKVFETKG